MNSVASCPRDDQVVAFHQGRLTEGEMVEVLEHAESCSTCADRLGRMGETADSLVMRLKRSAQRAPFPEERDCRELEIAALALDETISRDREGCAIAARPLTLPMMLGPYEVRMRIDGGGMGDVYEAWHTRLKKLVAIKVLTPERANHLASIARFQREMEASGLVGDHAHVVRVMDANEHHGVHYLALELIRGRDLSELAARLGPLPIADACELMRQAAIGLAHLHDRGVIHRDFKPSNIMVTPEGAVKILDLGLAMLPRDTLEFDETLTDAWTVMGTADYMAPEQIFDAHRVTAAADLYSLGCTLFRLLAGRAPFEEPQYAARAQKFKAQTMIDPPKLNQFRPDAPRELIDLVARLLAKSPNDRAGEAAHVALDLARFAGDADIPALMKRCDGRVEAARLMFQDTPPNPVAATTALPRSRRRHWRRSIAAIAVGVVAIMLGGGIALHGVPGDRNSIEKDDPIEPGQWNSAFRKDPTPLIWDIPVNGSDFKLDKQRQILNVAYHGNVTMLSCGKIDWDDGYSLEVGIKPVGGWGQPLGIFFGYKEWDDQGDHFYQCQVIRLVPFHLENPDTAFRLERYKIVARNQTPRSISIGNYALIPWPRDQQVQLSMTYSRQRHGLIDVKWGAIDGANLARPDGNALFNHEDYQGQFGIWQHTNAVTYYDYRFLLSKEKDEK